MLFRGPGARVVVARRLGGRPLFTPPACAHWLPWRAAEASGLVTHQAGRAGCRGAQGRPPLGSFGRWQRRLTGQDMAADVVLYARHPHALAGLPCFYGADVIVQCLQCLLPQFCLRSRYSAECAACRRRDEAGTWLAVGSSAGLTRTTRAPGRPTFVPPVMPSAGAQGCGVAPRWGRREPGTRGPMDRLPSLTSKQATSDDVPFLRGPVHAVFAHNVFSGALFWFLKSAHPDGSVARGIKPVVGHADVSMS
jgi:hypothetical protein